MASNKCMRYQNVPSDIYNSLPVAIFAVKQHSQKFLNLITVYEYYFTQTITHTSFVFIILIAHRLSGNNHMTFKTIFIRIKITITYNFVFN